MSKHSQAKLYPSELATIGILFALKGGYFQAFYRWLKGDYADLLVGLPDRTRLRRLLEQPRFFTVINSYPIELLSPIREGLSSQQIRKKIKDKGRWSFGIKICWLPNFQGQVVAWNLVTMYVSDQQFHPLMERVNGQSIVQADNGFPSAAGTPDNCKLCTKGTWNERICVETALLMVTVSCDLKRLHHYLPPYIQARLVSVEAMFNVLLTLFHRLHPDADPFQMSIANGYYFASTIL